MHQKKKDRPTDKHTWKWPHSSSTPEYLERRHQYRRSEFRYRSKKQALKKLSNKTASLERGRIKERRESFISYSRDELFKKCDHEENCDCGNVKKELTETLKGRSKSETRNPEVDDNHDEIKDQTPLSPLEIKIYTSKTLPKRIEKIKKSREKKETAKFYTDLNDDETQKVENENELKIIEACDDTKPKDVQFQRRDSDIVKSILVQSDLANRRLQKATMPRRKSFEQVDHGSPLSRRKLEEALEAIKVEGKTNSCESPTTPQKPIDEPLYEELLRNVHVPYKFAPPMLKRSQSVSSASSCKDIAVKTVDKNQASSTTTINDDDESEDYVMLTYSDDKLEAVDGVNVSQNSPKNQSNSQLNHGSSDDIKQLDKPVKSFLHKFMKSPQDEDSKSISSSRKSFDGGLNSSWKNMIYKNSSTDITAVFNPPPIYRQGSEDLGCRIANVDYADPKKLFASNSNILINKSSLYQQRDSVVSTSSDSIIDSQKQIPITDPFSDSYYEDTAESVLESKDFRDSAIYSDDSNEKRSDSTLSPDDHIYATVNKPPTPTKPALPKKPSLLIKPNFTSRLNVTSPTTSIPPPIPCKPSNLKSPEVRNAIFSYRKNHLNATEDKSSTVKDEKSENLSNSWVKQQVGKFQ